MNNPPGFTWKFYRQGGLNQVILETAEEIRRLPELDPKLWTALSCPAAGLEFHPRTLALIDTDHDGRIRIPEILAAVQWLCARLKDPATMIVPPENLPLSFIDDQSEEGLSLLAAARVIWENSGRGEPEAINEEDLFTAAAAAEESAFNGDGILPPLDSLEPETRQFIKDGLAVMGGVTDASQQPGLNLDTADAFIKSITAWRAWRTQVSGADSPLGSDTPEAWDLMGKLKDKIDDYFLRCEFSSFAPGSTEALNADDKWPGPLENGPLAADLLLSWPLARVAPERPLSAFGGLNPAWRGPVERFIDLTKPLLAKPGLMTRQDWLKIQNAFAIHTSALAARPVLEAVETTVPPTSTLDQLGAARIEEILSSRIYDRFKALALKDLDAPAASPDLARLERLFFYHRHLYRLLMNFISFHDFYTAGHQAIFQSGTLYLDGRSCTLCVPVADVDKHAALATYSHLCLVYCECRRLGKAGQSAPDGVMRIAAAMTAGDADLLMEGRNGVFIDNFGHDWDATVIKVVSNPISLRQAAWAPYKRLGRLISEQAEKLASAKNDNLLTAASQKISTLPKTTASAPAAKPGFDLGRNVGIFAAIGLALGALGTALASIAKSILILEWWQMPLLFAAIFLLISGPSVFLAWLKLRRRTLGPFLEASGWAVNSGLTIDLALGRELTATAVWPPNASRSRQGLKLPPPRKWPLVIGALLLLAGLIFGWWWLDRGAETKSRPRPAPVAAEDAGGQPTPAPPAGAGTAPGSSAAPRP